MSFVNVNARQFFLFFFINQCPMIQARTLHQINATETRLIQISISFSRCISLKACGFWKHYYNCVFNKSICVCVFIWTYLDYPCPHVLKTIIPPHIISTLLNDLTRRMLHANKNTAIALHSRSPSVVRPFSMNSTLA